MVIESLESAVARGARIRSEIVGYGMSADAFHVTAPEPSGSGAIRAMESCIADGDIDRADIGYVNAHGTSTPLGDVAEVRAVRAVLEDHANNIIMGSTKSMTGHLLGAAGGLEFSICSRVVETGWIPPTINQEENDPKCDLNCAPNEKVQRDVSVALSNSFGFGGHNVSIAIQRFEE